MKLALKSTLLVVVAGAAIFVAVLSSRSSKHRDDAYGRQAIFQQVWQTIGTKFYDRSMNGLDWLAVRSVYGRKVQGAKDSFELYWHVLIPMATALETSHVEVSPPSRNSDVTGEVRASLNARESELETCAGLVSHLGRRHISSRVLNIEASSALHAFGVRAGWRFYGVEEGASGSVRHISLAFLTTSGETRSFELPVTERLDGIDPRSIKADLAALMRERNIVSDPNDQFTLGSLGITVTVGRTGTMPAVVDIVDGSLSERIGIEPGSVIQEMRVKQGKVGGRHFEGKMLSPSGKENLVSFDYRCEARPRNLVRVAHLLRNNTLYLRFDVFDDGAARWIGDELSRVQPRAVILDLRRNMGGNVSEVRDAMGWFFPAGTKLAVMSAAETSEVAVASASPFVFDGPMAVLVGPHTASGAEISANAMKIHKRAILYGLDSFGNVLQAIRFPLDDGGSVMVATHDVRGPDGKRIENVGVKVDHEVKQTLASVRSGRDVVIDRALADLAQITSN